MGITQRLARLKNSIGRRLIGDYDGAGRFVSSNAGAIHDGLNYDLPVIVTGDMRRGMSESAIQEYVESTAATFRFQFDTPQRGASDLPIPAVSEDPLLEWSYTTRRMVLSNCHAAYQRNPLAKRAINYVSAFTIGNGFNLTCHNKDVEKVLQDFIDSPDNCIREYERQAVKDLLVDGELVIRYYSEGGETVAVPQRPWELEYIRTEKGFFRRPTSYHFQRWLTEGDSPFGAHVTEMEDVPADEIQHVAINKHGYELRGRPELFGVLAWLRAYKEWLENRARQNFWRGALLWFIQVMGGTSALIGAVAARWMRPPTPGSVAVESDKVNVQALQNPVGAGDAGEDGRQIKLMVAVGVGLPEYFLADGSNSNLASTKSQQLPAMMTFGEFQRILVEQVWYPMFKRVIQNAIDANILPEEVIEQDADGDDVHEELDADDEAPEMDAEEAFPPQQPNGAKPQPAPMPMVKPPKKGPVKKLATLDAFDVEYEPIGDKEPFTLAQALSIAVDKDWISNETASTEMGFDYAIEQKKITRERARHQNDIADGLVPPPMGLFPPEFAGADKDDEPEKVKP